MEISEARIEVAGVPYAALQAGPVSGPLVLCLHGFPDGYRSFRHQLPVLAAAGYRVVAPTLRGYTPETQRSGRPYHLAALAADVCSLLDALQVERAHLVGHDWGAAIGYTAAALQPGRLISLTALAVPHPLGLVAALSRRPTQLRHSWYIGLFQLDGLAERVVRARDFAFLAWLWRQWSPGWQAPPAELAAVKATFAQPGVVEAALAYYRASARAWNDPAIRGALEALRRPLGVPTLALSGATDGCMERRFFDLAMRPSDFAAGLQLERVEGAGHFLHQERPEVVSRLLLEWLGSHRAGAAA